MVLTYSPFIHSVTTHIFYKQFVFCVFSQNFSLRPFLFLDILENLKFFFFFLRIIDVQRLRNQNMIPFVLILISLRKFIINLFGKMLLQRVMMMMMNSFCGVVDRWKAFSLIASRYHCQRSWTSQISDMPRAGFEPAQNLS